ncbi:unnamed protein product [Enterobius vermicularis]|uniref:3-keto-5-aminohexanoate cleavage protein n=1 Tax=Enterobius vermicularis TaxID=51028 RepID=A0A0N4V5L2_ENTVE|nr:unnamed protein product [Enterobius vermicularis]
MKIVRKIISQVRNIDTKIRDGAELLGSCVLPTEHSNEEAVEIGLPDSFRHLATLRLEEGWLTARCTDQADPSTLGVIAAAGVQPLRTTNPSIE